MVYAIYARPPQVDHKGNGLTQYPKVTPPSLASTVATVWKRKRIQNPRRQQTSTAYLFSLWCFFFFFFFPPAPRNAVLPRTEGPMHCGGSEDPLCTLFIIKRDFTHSTKRIVHTMQPRNLLDEAYVHNQHSRSIPLEACWPCLVRKVRIQIRVGRKKKTKRQRHTHTHDRGGSGGGTH